MNRHQEVSPSFEKSEHRSFQLSMFPYLVAREGKPYLTICATHDHAVKIFKRYHDGINRDDYVIDGNIPSCLCVIAQL